MPFAFSSNRMHRVSAFLLGAFALLSVGDPLHAGDRYALVIGVHQYDKNQLRSLPYAESDAVAVADRLKAIGFRRVVLMTQTLGAKEARFLPTATNLREAIEGFLDPKKWEEDDTAVIVLSGHGVQFKGQETSFFCPMDASLAKPATLIEINDIYSRLEKCPAAFKLLIADCCRNDPQSDVSRARAEVSLESVTRPQRMKPPGGVAAFYSCSAGEKAFESPDLKRGVFTHFLLEGLSDGRADSDRNGNVDLDELVRFTRRKVTDYVSDQFGETTIQVPELVGKTRGVVAIVELAKAASSPAAWVPRSTPSPASSDALKTIASKATGMTLVLIPAGEFRRGSPDSDEDAGDDEKPQHSVRISKSFYLGQHEVTQGEWKAVMATEPWKGKSHVVEGDDCAATYVSSSDALTFAMKLSQKDGRMYRLPTEAEWEYACRGGATTRFGFGDDESKLSEFGWWGGLVGDGNAKSEQHAHTVGLLKPNGFGLFDMHGNVSEWCADSYEEKAYAAYGVRTARDPLGYSGQKTRRVARGGSWYNTSGHCRSAYRNWFAPEDRLSHLGFRLVAIP